MLHPVAVGARVLAQEAVEEVGGVPGDVEGLRLAVTGRKASPPLFSIDRALRKCALAMRPAECASSIPNSSSSASCESFTVSFASEKEGAPVYPATNIGTLAPADFTAGQARRRGISRGAAASGGFLRQGKSRSASWS